MKDAFACLFLLACSLTPVASFADVWKVVGDDGSIQYTNEAPGKRGQLVIDSNSGSVSRASSAPTTSHALGAVATVAVINASPAYQAARGSLATASENYGVDYDLIKAVVSSESAFNPSAISKKGAVGLMQLMPETAKRYGVMSEPGTSITAKLKNPDLNIQTGTRYLADLIRLYSGNTELALAAYNAGEGAVARAGNQIPNYSETQNYVKKVLAVYKALQARAG